MRPPNLVVGCLLWLCVPLQAAAQPPAADLWQLYQESRESDPRLLAAQARSRSSSWSEREALGQMLPQIGVSSAFNRTTSETALQQANYNGERYAIGLSQVLYNPELWHSYKRFAAISAVQDAQSRDTREAAGLELVERYFAVLAAEDALALAQAERRATRLNLERVQALFDKQMVKVTDVLEARARTDALASAEIAAANQVQVSREGLSQLIGRPVTEHLRRLGEQVPFNLPPEAREYWVQRALADNPALQAHQRAVLAAQAGEREARAGHLPKVSLNLTGQRSDIGYENSLTPRTDTYVASINVQLPLYSGGSTRARAEAMREQLRAAEYDYEAARRQLLRETREAFYAVHTSQARMVAARPALVSAQKARQAAERALGYGVIDAVQVLDTVEAEYRAHRDLLKSRYDFVMSVLALRRWSGSLLDSDVRMASAWLVEA